LRFRFLPIACPSYVSRTWRDRLLGAATGVALTLATLWLILVSAATATVILRASAKHPRPCQYCAGSDIPQNLVAGRQGHPRLFPYCLRVCLALLCVMFIAYLVALDVSLLSACLPRSTLYYVYCLPCCFPTVVCVCLAGCRRTKDRVGSCVSLGAVMTRKLCISLAGEAVIPQWRKRYKGRAR